jgi:hypothetical protein
MRLVEVAINGHLRAQFFLHVCRETAQASDPATKHAKIKNFFTNGALTI